MRASVIDLTYMGGIERGKRNPTLLVIVRLANALHVRPHDLFDAPPGWSDTNSMLQDFPAKPDGKL